MYLSACLHGCLPVCLCVTNLRCPLINTWLVLTETSLNRNCLGQIREIPWNQTTDVHRGSTSITRVITWRWRYITWRWRHRNNVNTMTTKQTASMKFMFFSIKYRYSDILLKRHKLHLFCWLNIWIIRIIDFNRAEPTCYRTNFPYAISGLQNGSFWYMYIVLRVMLLIHVHTRAMLRFSNCGGLSRMNRPQVKAARIHTGRHKESMWWWFWKTQAVVASDKCSKTRELKQQNMSVCHKPIFLFA